MCKDLELEKQKAIYLNRNPRDVITSGFYYWRAIQCVRNPDTFEQYFEWFLQGNVTFGSRFDHIHGWLQMRGKENFLIVSYAELYRDIRASVEKITQFLGKRLGPKEFNSVLKNIPFEVMKTNKMNNFPLAPDSFTDHSKVQLMRKGAIGDWKHHFAVAQSEIFDKIHKEKMVGLPQGFFPWES
ncbi:sulfotransferase 2A1-like [Loxodonta africana]|uniref:sulfotransferase 2A1-like n=1 Tax=Loxodonta africana TaxID=9785 RepID=UPI0030CF0B37